MSGDNEQAILAVLRHASDVTKVTGGLVPLVDSKGDMKNHFLANITLENLAHTDDLEDLLEHLRDIAFDTFNRLRQDADVSKYATICISLFTPISSAEGLRIYRTRLETSNLPGLQRGTLKDFVTGEESGKSDLNDLLQTS